MIAPFYSPPLLKTSNPTLGNRFVEESVSAKRACVHGIGGSPLASLRYGALEQSLEHAFDRRAVRTVDVDYRVRWGDLGRIPTNWLLSLNDEAGSSLPALPRYALSPLFFFV